MTGGSTRDVLHRFLAAIASRDPRRVHRMLGPDVTWENVPHPPATGRDDVVDMLAAVLTRADEVSWDVVSEAYDGGVGWLERIDRFSIDGVELAVGCNGVFSVDPADGVVAVRDYVDLAPWRAQLGAALDACARRSAIDVVRRHLAAVDRRDPVAMAADYEASAELTRGERVHRGRFEIADYFDTVPIRLAGRRLTFDTPVLEDDNGVHVGWEIFDDSGLHAAGTDIYRVVAGRIASQHVEMITVDF